MARAISPERLRERSGVALTPTFDDIPERLRPSAWRQWLGEVAKVPTTDDEKDAAYPDEGWRPNPFVSKAAQARFDPGRPVRGWRDAVARARQYDAYAQWCQDNGMCDERGCLLPAWRWLSVKRWEAER